MKFSRIWEMPNHNTFDIRCIKSLDLYRYLKPEFISIDPFANKCRMAQITNDLNPDYNCNYSLDAVDLSKNIYR